MELRQLQAVLAVAQHASFTRAARELHTSQPALSSQIGKLELELGSRLFDRTTRRVTLTSAGTAFIARAARILDECDKAVDEMAEFASGVRGTVRVGAWYSVNPGLPEMLASFVAALPGVEVRVSEESSSLMLDLVRRNELDVTFLVLLPDLDMSGIEYFVHMTEPFVAITSPASPLAGRAELLIDDLRSVPLIVMKTGSALRLVVERFFAASGVQPSIAMETTETFAARAFVSRGLGVALVPQCVAEREGPPVAIVPLRNAPIHQAAVAWRQGFKTRATQALVAHARGLFPDAPIISDAGVPAAVRASEASHMGSS